MISRTWVVWLIGCIVALEPHMVFYTTFYASEGLALIFLYLGIASLMRWFYSSIYESHWVVQDENMMMLEELCFYEKLN
jgi:hypothetical protein